MTGINRAYYDKSMQEANTQESLGFKINRFLTGTHTDYIRIKFVLCSKMSFISWWFKVFEDLCSLHNLKHEFLAEIYLIPFVETN